MRCRVAVRNFASVFYEAPKIWFGVGGSSVTTSKKISTCPRVVKQLEVTKLRYRCLLGTDSIYSPVQDSDRILLKQGQERCACISEGGT